MKKSQFLILLLALSTPLMAQGTPSLNRNLQQYGAMMTWGQDSGFSAENWGVSARTLTYFDGTQTDGFYYSVLSGAILHNVGSVSFADLRLLGLGWRGNPLTPAGIPNTNFSVDFGLAPTAELRLKKGQIALDSESIGMGATVGVYVPVGEWGDVGISWEPVIDLRLLPWGNDRVRDANYADFVVSWVVKSVSETRSLPWSEGRRP